MVSGTKKPRSVFQKNFMSLEIRPCCKIWLIDYEVKGKVMMG